MQTTSTTPNSICNKFPISLRKWSRALQLALAHVRSMALHLCRHNATRGLTTPQTFLGHKWVDWNFSGSNLITKIFQFFLQEMTECNQQNEKIEENPINQEEPEELPQIDWPVRSIENVDYENSYEEDDFNRPDSGVGESVRNKILFNFSENLFINQFLFQAEHLTVSLGDLCHAKRSLRLPLSAPAEEESLPEAKVLIEVSDELTFDKKHIEIEDEQNEHNIIDDDEDKSNSDDLHILPTPSCLGSMDSLSSSSASSDRPSFSTFGKINKNLNDDDLQPNSIVFIEDDIKQLMENQKNDKNLQKTTELEIKEKSKYLINNKHVLSLSASTRLSDSTDEDSGKFIGLFYFYFIRKVKVRTPISLKLKISFKFLVSGFENIKNSKIIN